LPPLRRRQSSLSRSRRGLYQQYFRQGFANGYRDGYNGH
jgi:hypothetical protein